MEKFITSLALISFLVFGSMIDSDSIVPYVVCGLSALWIASVKDKLEDWYG